MTDYNELDREVQDAIARAKMFSAAMVVSCVVLAGVILLVVRCTA